MKFARLNLRTPSINDGIVMSEGLRRRMAEAAINIRVQRSAKSFANTLNRRSRVSRACT